MARGRGPVLIASSLLLAAAAAWIANRWIVARSIPNTAQAPAMVPVLSAAMSLPIGTTIANRHVAIVQMLKTQAPAGSFHDVKQILGKVTTTNVQAGQLLLASMFGDPGETSLAASVKKNMRAITVRVNDVIGVAGFLLPGSRVDVVSTISRIGTGIATSRTILSDIKVLAVDQTTATKSDEPVMVRAVTLEVTPKQAETLLKGQAAGSIQLTLRNPSDHGDSVDLAGPVRAPTGHPLRHAPPPLRPVTVIRGTEVARVARHE